MTMRKHNFLTLLVFLSTAIILFSSNTVMSQNHGSVPGRSPKLVPEVESVVFDKDSAFHWCPWNSLSCLKEDLKIKVATRVTESVDAKLTYYYIPSYGTIVGEGPNVVWDLSEVGPGRFSITVGVGIGNVIQGKTLTRTFNAELCPVCHPRCYCPSIDIWTPSAFVRVGSSFILSTDVRGLENQRITYQWSISEGEIIAGQNTPRILIKTVSGMKNNELKATLKIGGTDPACNCPTTASKNISVILENH